MRFQTLDEWLRWQETLHPSEIELGLERVSAVASRLGLDQPGFKVITVAGTNGKGSSVALLAAILQAAGYQVGAYTSPHLWRYNERIRIQGKMADDDSLCQAFAAIDAARGDISLTYFEFGTLAAIYCFAQAKVDVALLEVGLGGRLDAVNILDADVALISAIDLDHAQWLGNDRETIGREKAGIMRPGRPVVCSDPRPPVSIVATAAEMGAELYQLGEDFHWQVQVQADGWDWQGPQETLAALPCPGLAGQHQLHNAAGVLMVLALLKEAMPVSRQALETGLTEVKMPGRFQVSEGEPRCIFDVAHNPQSARALAENLARQPCRGKTFAVVAMLDDKDLEGVIAAMRDCVDGWYVAGLEVPRGASAQRLAEVISDARKPTQVCATVAEAKAMALAEAGPQDRIVVFGSFYTVAAALSEAV